MTLRARALEKALLRRHRQARRGSARLKYEDARSRRYRGRSGPVVSAVLALWPFVPVLVLLQTSRLDAAYALAALYATGTALVRARHLLDELRYGEDVAVLGILAASDSLLLDRAWRRMAGSSLFALAAFAPLAALPFTAGRSTGSTMVAVAATLLGWGVVVASAALAAVWVQRRVLLVGGIAQLAVFGAMFVTDRIPPVLPPFVHAAMVLTPGGWLAESLRSCARGDAQQGLVWLVLPSALVATLPWSRRRLRNSHRTAEIHLSPVGLFAARLQGEPEDEAMAAVVDPDVLPAEPRGVYHGGGRDPATLADVQSLLQPMCEHPKGAVEHVACSVLTPRERAVAELFLGDALVWTVAWRIGVVAGLAAAALSFIPGIPSFAVWACGLVALIAAPLGGGRWEGFDLVHNGAAYSPRHAPYPVGFAEVTRTILKVNAVRLLAALPAVLLLGLGIGRALGLTTADGFGLGARIFLVLVALQPATITIKFARGTNDIDDAGTGLLIAIFVIPIGCLFLAGVIGTLTANALPLVLVGCAVTATTAWLLLLGYGLAYGRPWFDLVRRNRDDLPS